MFEGNEDKVIELLNDTEQELKRASDDGNKNRMVGGKQGVGTSRRGNNVVHERRYKGEQGKDGNVIWGQGKKWIIKLYLGTYKE